MDKRDQAIAMLMELVDPAEAQPLALVKCTHVVDALIEAARAPESKHTRDITAAQRKALNDPRV